MRLRRSIAELTAKPGIAAISLDPCRISPPLIKLFDVITEEGRATQAITAGKAWLLAGTSNGIG